MGVFGHLSALLPAIERAVNVVEQLLKQNFEV
jgi:hypothetical protein